MEKSNIRAISTHPFQPDRPAIPMLQKLESDSIPTQAAIAQRAYEYFHKRGGRHGLDKQDWFSAERDLMLRN